MNVAKKIFEILFFSLSGPLIILFGTFSGLILSIEIIFGFDINKKDYSCYFWLYLAYLILMTIALGFNSFRLNTKKSANRDLPEEDRIELITNEIERKKFWRNILYGGYPLLVEWVLDKKGIFLYDIFKKPSYWDQYPDAHEEYPIIRFYKNERSMEIRFPKGIPRKVLVRTTLPNSHAYGDFHDESLFKWPTLFLVTPIKFLSKLLF